VRHAREHVHLRVSASLEQLIVWGRDQHAAGSCSPMHGEGGGAGGRTHHK
jgi:hypothetical protein